MEIFSLYPLLIVRPCRWHRQFVLFGFNRELSAVQFKINAIYGFVPYSIYSRKKQMPVHKGPLFISMWKPLYTQIPAYLCPEELIKDF